jgi:hypothetical protein
MSNESKRILVLYWYPEKMRPALRHHLEAIKYSPHQHVVEFVNTFAPVSAQLQYRAFDVILLHTSLLCLRWSDHYHPKLRELAWVRDHPCLKIAMPQDEYDHSEILDEWLYHWRVQVVFTNFDASSRRLLYPILHDKADFVQVFTGYIDPATAASLEDTLPPSADRTVDIVYRAAHLPYSFGRQGQLKQHIADVVRTRAEACGLRCDISTRPEDTIVSDAWFKFLLSARAIIGIESGSRALDARGEVAAHIRHLLAKDPDMTFEEVDRTLPPGWDSHRFFAIGPRHFEAVYTKTVQVLVEGEYNGVLVAERHYIPLKEDLSNLDEVLERLRDAPQLQKIADTAYEEIYQSKQYDYVRFCRQIDEVIQEHSEAPSPWWKVSARCAAVLQFAGTEVASICQRVATSNVVQATLPSIAPPPSIPTSAVPRNKLSAIPAIFVAELPSLCQGRLTTQTGVAFPTGGLFAQAYLFFTPYNGNRVALCDGESWSVYAFSEFALSLAAVKKNTNYDVFLCRRGDECKLELVAWRGDQARALALELRDGIYVDARQPTSRYLGTIRGAAKGCTEDSVAKRFVWNYCNQLERNLFTGDTNAHTYIAQNGDECRMWNGDSKVHIDFVQGMPQQVNVQSECILKSNEAGEQALVYPTLDGSLTCEPEIGRYAGNFSAHYMTVCTAGAKVLKAGYHTVGIAQKSNPRGATFANVWIRASLCG